VNVSTGAAVRALPGLGAYGSAKAALLMAGQVLAAELDMSHGQGGAPRDVSIMSFEPGLVDTEMQAAVRSSSADTLPILDFFKQAAAEGRLVPPAVPAAAIADYVEADGNPTFVNHHWEAAT